MVLEEDVINKFPQDVLKSLLGQVYDFYGVDGDSFCIGVNGARFVLEALEDPDDGYRSYFKCFVTKKVGKVFFKNPIAKVKFSEGGRSSRIGPDVTGMSKSEKEFEEARHFTGWVLKDVVTGHTWLTIGTDYGDDYYPCFTFRYEPDKTQKLNEGDH